MHNANHQPPLPGLMDSATSPPNERPAVERPNRIGETKVAYGESKEILTRATGFMDEYDFTLNPYSGCSFGCTYCYAAFFSRDVEKRDSWGYWVRRQRRTPSTC